MKTFVQDVRYGLRVFTTNPGFAAVVILTLALGIGANTAIFSVVNAVLLRPLPFPSPDRLTMVWERKDTVLRNVVSPANFLAWKDENDVFDKLAAFVTLRAGVTGRGEAEEVTTQFVSGEFFEVLGVPAALGRALTPADCTPDSPDVVVLSHGHWQRHFSGDPKVVGTSMTINGHPAEIVGVMPPAFAFHVRDNAIAHGAPEMWGGMAFRDGDRIPRGRYLSAVARLAPGVDLQRAKATMDGL